MEVVDRRGFTAEGERIEVQREVIRRGRSIEGTIPAFDRVLVKIIPTPESELSIIASADAFQEPSDYATVVAVGQGVYFGSQVVPIPFEKGDTVRFSQNSRETAEFWESDHENEFAFVRAQDVRCFWKG